MKRNPGLRMVTEITSTDIFKRSVQTFLVRVRHIIDWTHQANSETAERSVGIPKTHTRN